MLRNQNHQIPHDSHLMVQLCCSDHVLLCVSTRVLQVHLVFRELLELLDLLYVLTAHPHLINLYIISIILNMKQIETLTNAYFREVMVNQVLEDSRVCLDRREMKDPGASLDLLVPSVCR